ncbi:hypothetical protein, partial [Schaalia odontolytica]
QAHATVSHAFERRFAPCFRDPSFSLRSLPFGATRKTIRRLLDIVKSYVPNTPSGTFPQNVAETAGGQG